MQCSKEEALVRLFYNASSSFQLLFFLLFSFFIFLLKFLNYIGSYPLIHSDQEYDYVYTEDEEEKEEDEEKEIEERYCYKDSSKRDHLVADIVCGGDTLLFWHNEKEPQSVRSFSEEFITPQESLGEESEENNNCDTETSLSVHRSPQVSDFEVEETDAAEDENSARDADSPPYSVPTESRPTPPMILNLYKTPLLDNDKNCDEDHVVHGIGKKKKVIVGEKDDERHFVFAPTLSETKKFMVEKDDEEIDGDSYTVTSKSSSEWRSSYISRESGTDDHFSSSSRRSCPKWESYTVFQKYDEEMTFLNRISAQKLEETESLRSIQASPRSISERIVYKFSNVNKTPAAIRQNPYGELEAAYVAQICLTWEALNWNYKSFQSKRASSCHDVDLGCPAVIAQQFQEFQVLLQRYIENEPYEHGKRPEIYARMRLLAPKLLLVPEYRDSEDNQRDDVFNSRISSASFLMIMEDGIRTFMNFLKVDKEKCHQILAAYFRRNRRGLVDPTLLRLMKKVNQKKKMKIKDLRHPGKCLRKRKLRVDVEMEILMALIDLKVVSRVLRMSDISEEQLHWCEEKMSKVRVMDGILQRDSSPLFFPAH